MSLILKIPFIFFLYPVISTSETASRQLDNIEKDWSSFLVCFVSELKRTCVKLINFILQLENL